MRVSGLHRVRRSCCRCDGPEGCVLSLMAFSRASLAPTRDFVAFTKPRGSGLARDGCCTFQACLYGIA